MAEPALDRLVRLAATDPAQPVVELLRPRSPTVVDGSWVTRGAWVRSAASLAGGLAARGVRPGDRVILCLPTGRAFLDAFVGALWCGAIAVPLPSLEGLAAAESFRERLAHVLASAAPSLVVADEHTRAFLARRRLVAAAVPVVDARDLIAEPAPRHPARADDGAFLQYTSGSTGEPRGVRVTHGNLAAQIEALGAALRLDARDRTVSWLPLHHDMGLVGGLLTPALHGATTALLAPLDFLVHPALWLHAISARRATMTVAPNFAFSLLARRVPDEQLRGLDLASLRVAVDGGELVDAETVRRFQARFAAAGLAPHTVLPVYGLAEATLAVTVPAPRSAHVVERVHRERLAAERRAVLDDAGVPIVGVGPPIPGHTVTIVDPSTGEALGERRLGEITVRGPSVSPGFHGAPPLADHTLRTGDLGYLADGVLFVVDRLKDLVLIAGRSYSPSDIERAVAEVPGVRLGRAVAFGVPLETTGTESLVVVAEARGRPRELAPAIARAVLERTGLSPGAVVLVAPRTLPRTSSGKLQRRATRRLYLGGGLVPMATSPRWARLREALGRWRLAMARALSLRHRHQGA